MGPVSGLLWLAATVVAVVCRFVPGAPDGHDALFWGLAGFTAAYSVACITRLIPWHRVSIEGHAITVVACQPLVATALYVTGGADAYLGPVLVLPMLYVAYFFPLRYAVPLGAVEILTYASPLLAGDQGHMLVHRTISYAVAYVGLVATIQFLKRRLVAAERHQHRIARVDPLTGLANRRAFDEALDAAFADDRTFTAALVDIDYFKQINDRFGHTTGDRVLRELAAHASAAVRSGDCLARIGGDEFALVAPGAGAETAERLSETLRAAGLRVDAGDGPVSLTVVAAVHPTDGEDRATLLRALDRRLHDIKDARASR
ncbi:GGDEF domain-containing protein [Solirubrobacter sp. CPCC 204708]|uniref:GGDEF domain-containing protein n=1 Tax=Solirubrobacter deserti TaxID=2282478 RepID=A0ABT4RSQ2_9ACTN|nr:GGDEF domain-containing protein [Solirubrobacter deserti]MBE2317582.1 GGDEF domain-containing protein [Solirubrobacter deserti]MDA0141276.1 GGDEF domain-containing protein [Solirubrobacter deserti]